MKNPKNIAYALLRITIGVNFLSHGLVRIPKINTFSHWMVGMYKGNLLPSFLVTPFSFGLPFAEFIIGLLLVIGLFTYRATIAGAMMMIVLIFGSCMIEQWDWVGIQMIYALFFYLLITNIENNTLTLDKNINQIKL